MKRRCVVWLVTGWCLVVCRRRPGGAMCGVAGRRIWWRFVGVCVVSGLVSGCSSGGLLGSRYVTPGPTVSASTWSTIVPSPGVSSSGVRSADDVYVELIGQVQRSGCVAPAQVPVRFSQVWRSWFSSRGVRDAKQWPDDESFQLVVLEPVKAFGDLCPAAAVAAFRAALVSREPAVAQHPKVRSMLPASRPRTKPAATP